MADFFYKHKSRYPLLATVKTKPLHLSGIFGYIIGAAVACFSPGVPPPNGIIAAVPGDIVVDLILASVGLRQDRDELVPPR